MTWRDRIVAAKQPRGRWDGVRGFTRGDRLRAADWYTCAVGEQIARGLVDASVLKDPRMRRLGVEFHHAVRMPHLLGRWAVRRTEVLLDQIEDYALELDLRRAMTRPAPEQVTPPTPDDRPMRALVGSR